MNRTRLEAIADAITAHPEFFGMDDWSYGVPPRLCIGGTARALYPDLCGKTTATHDAQGELMEEYADAVYILGLVEGQADRLLFLTGWPENYQRMYLDAKTDAARASIAKARMLSMAYGYAMVPDTQPVPD